jgi:hypothetical protein
VSLIGPVAYAVTAYGVHVLRTGTARLWRRARTGVARRR